MIIGTIPPFPNRLVLSWSISRGRDTSGYNICRLDSCNTGKRYRTMGGGYDMVGAALGEWLTREHQDELRTIAHRAGSYYSKAEGYKSHRTLDDMRPDPAYLYGMTRDNDTGAVSIDGACGVGSVRAIAEAIGIFLESFHDRNGRTLGFIVRRNEVQQAA